MTGSFMSSLVFLLVTGTSVWSIPVAENEPASPSVSLSPDLTADLSLTNLKAHASSIASAMLEPFKIDPKALNTGMRTQGGQNWYWWTYGVVWNSMVNYVSFTKDSTFKQKTIEALVCQSRGKDANLNFWNEAQGPALAIDDITWWANAALTAVGAGLDEPSHVDITWLQMAENAYAAIADQADNRRPLNDCPNAAVNNLGIWWKIQPSPGYTWVSSITNAGYMSMAARLYRQTRRQEYLDRVNDIWEFSVQTRLIVGDESNLVSPAWEVRDGFTHESPDQECMASDTTPDKNLLAYNLAVYMYAASVMASIKDLPNQKQWKSRTIGLLNAALSPNNARNAAPGFTYADTGILFEAQYDSDVVSHHDHTVHKAIMSSALVKTGMNLGWPTEYNIKQNIGNVLQNTANAILKNGVCDKDTCKAPFDPRISESHTLLEAADENGDNSGQFVSALEVLQDLIYMTENGLLTSSKT